MQIILHIYQMIFVALLQVKRLPTCSHHCKRYRISKRELTISLPSFSTNMFAFFRDLSVQFRHDLYNQKFHTWLKYSLTLH